MVAGLKIYQQQILPEKLYAVSCKGKLYNGSPDQPGEQLQPSIEIYGGNAGDVHGSQVFPDAPPTGMPKLFTALNAIAAITLMPNYLFVHKTASDVVAVILSGVQAVLIELLGAEAYSETYVSADLVIDS